MEMMTENFCNDCDEVLHAVFDDDDFYAFKVGRIQCPCGCVVRPCNECQTRASCDECPWMNAKIVPAMTKEAYVQWCKENEGEPPAGEEWF